MKALVAGLLLLVSPFATALAQLAPARPDSAGVARAARNFLVAFDNLHWEPFAAVWAPAATVFLPEADQPHLVTGRHAVLAHFRALFAEVRAGGDGVPADPAGAAGSADSDGRCWARAGHLHHPRS